MQWIRNVMLGRVDPLPLLEDVPLKEATRLRIERVRREVRVLELELQTFQQPPRITG